MDVHIDRVSRQRQELAAHGRVVEEVSNLDPRAGRAVPGPYGGEFAAVAADLGAVGRLRRPRLQGDLRDAADRRQRLAAEAERADAEKIVGAAELARGMTGEREL